MNFLLLFFKEAKDHDLSVTDSTTSKFEKLEKMVEVMNKSKDVSKTSKIRYLLNINYIFRKQNYFFFSKYVSEKEYRRIKKDLLRAKMHEILSNREKSKVNDSSLEPLDNDFINISEGEEPINEVSKDCSIKALIVNKESNPDVSIKNVNHDKPSEAYTSSFETETNPTTENETKKIEETTDPLVNSPKLEHEPDEYNDDFELPETNKSDFNESQSCDVIEVSDSNPEPPPVPESLPEPPHKIEDQTQEVTERQPYFNDMLSTIEEVTTVVDTVEDVTTVPDTETEVSDNHIDDHSDNFVSSNISDTVEATPEVSECSSREMISEVHIDKSVLESVKDTVEVTAEISEPERPDELSLEEVEKSLVKSGGSQVEEFDDFIETGVLSTDEDVLSNEDDVEHSQTAEFEVDETDGVQSISCQDQSLTNLNLSGKSNNKIDNLNKIEAEILISDKEAAILTPKINEDKETMSVHNLQDDVDQEKQIDVNVETPVKSMELDMTNVEPMEEAEKMAVSFDDLNLIKAENNFDEHDHTKLNSEIEIYVDNTNVNQELLADEDSQKDTENSLLDSDKLVEPEQNPEIERSVVSESEAVVSCGKLSEGEMLINVDSSEGEMSLGVGSLSVTGAEPHEYQADRQS